LAAVRRRTGRPRRCHRQSDRKTVRRRRSTAENVMARERPPRRRLGRPCTRPGASLIPPAVPPTSAVVGQKVAPGDEREMTSVRCLSDRIRKPLCDRLAAPAVPSRPSPRSRVTPCHVAVYETDRLRAAVRTGPSPQPAVPSFAEDRGFDWPHRLACGRGRGARARPCPYAGCAVFHAGGRSTLGLVGRGQLPRRPATRWCSRPDDLRFLAGLARILRRVHNLRGVLAGALRRDVDARLTAAP